MSFEKNIWNQLKNLTAEDLCRALNRDGWTCDMKGGSMRIYMNAAAKRRVNIHYHPGKTYGAKMLQGLLEDIGWNEDQLRALKLIT